MPDNKPMSYQVRDGCWNCKGMFNRDHTQPISGRMFCTRLGGIRPKTVPEHYDALEDTEKHDSSGRGYEKWIATCQTSYDELKEWSKEREVLPAGFCDHHERKDIDA